MQYKTDSNISMGDPIVSTILKDEPEYVDLIVVFVERLPPTVAKVRQFFSESNWPQFRKEIHDLKGMGGSYGFPMVTELAGEIGHQLRQDNAEAVENLLQELEVISARIAMGMQKQAQKCA
ncbi:Hpt domain-containing protein [Kaarinaea lacus]